MTADSHKMSVPAHIQGSRRGGAQHHSQSEHIIRHRGALIAHANGNSEESYKAMCIIFGTISKKRLTEDMLLH